MPSLLAVDLGLHTGLALYGQNGRLAWARSQHIGGLPQLRRAAPALLHALPEAEIIVLEGGGSLAEIWERAAERAGRTPVRVSAEQWRADLLLDREQRSGAEAKRAAELLARRTIDWSGLSQPKSLRHDAAEAILIGLWGVVRVGWLAALPDALRRPAA